jgi:hypothetical protein
VIRRYLATLAVVIGLATLICTELPYVVRSCVLRGQTVNEKIRIEMSFDAGNNRYYRIDPDMEHYLQKSVNFSGTGAARVVSAKTAITGQKISWTEDKTTITAQGAVLTTQLSWDTPSDTKNGARGSIDLAVPRIFQGVSPTFHSGQYHLKDDKRWAVREMTAYDSLFQLNLARFMYALIAGVPFGLSLHTIGWAFVVYREKKARIKTFPAQDQGYPRTFYPNPIAEWVVGLCVLGIGAFVTSMLAGFGVLDNFIDDGMTWFIAGTLSLTVMIALTCAYFSSKSALTIRIDTTGLAYIRGRQSHDWTTTAWSETSTIVEKYRKYRGTTSYWIEIEFKDNRKKLKIPTSTVGYPVLRGILFAEP